MRVVLTGIYNNGEIRTGSEEVAVSVFRELQKHTETFFVTKYSMIKPHSFWEKLFGLKREQNLYYAGFLRMPFLIKKLNPDILHGINYHPFVGLMFWWFRKSKAKLCYTVNGVVAYENSRKKYLSAFFKLSRHYTEKLIFRNSHLLFFFDELQKGQIAGYYGNPSARFIVTMNGISDQLKAYKIVDKTNEAKLQLITLAGEESRINGIEVLLDSLSSLDIRFQLTILGNAGQLIIPQHLRTHIKIANKVSQSDFYEKLTTADLFICFSLFDSFSIATAEAMALGRTVIISEGVGIGKYISNEVDGFIVRLDQIEKIRQLLKMLYNDRSLLKKIGTAAKVKAQMFSWENITLDYINEYSRLIPHVR